MRKLALLIIILLACLTLTLPVSAAEPTWTANGTGWNATIGSEYLMKWNATGNWNWTVPSGVGTVEYLVIAGGGGASGGGGGAGGLLNGTLSVTPGTLYNLSVGVGGTGGIPFTAAWTHGGNGTNSSFGIYSSKGGGGGSGEDPVPPYIRNGSSGGSGGGGGAMAAGSTYGGAGYSGQGNNGGGNGGNSGTPFSAGGGGGAGQVGSNATNNTYAGSGGNGLQINITGNNTWYAGGGGGSCHFACTGGGVAGAGGGGAGNINGYGANATPNTGGGGGGGNVDQVRSGGYGASGVVIIRYNISSGDIIPPASITNLANVTTCNSINFTWSNPADADFNGTLNWLNNVAQTNLTKTDTYKLFSGLSGNTSYTFSTKTFDNATPSNINTTFVNLTSTTPICAPVASFTQNVTTGYDPTTALFLDTSTGTPLTWQWNYTVDGIGTPVTFNTSQNATRSFTAGNYSVRLYVTNAGGNDITTAGTHWVNVTTAPAPTAGFTASPLSGLFPQLVNFTDTSTGFGISSYQWDFDDGTANSTLQNPNHTYTVAGLFSPALTVTNLGGSNTLKRTNYINISAPPPPVSDFIGAPVMGIYPLNVSFTDTSTGIIVSYQWNFGDGTPNSTLQNPNHTYTYPSTFNVTLTTINTGGSSTMKKVGYINVTFANLNVNGTNINIGGTPQLVQFMVTNIWGAKIANANVGIQGITTTAGTFDWIIGMLNIPLNEVPIAQTYMSGTTDSNGAVEFMMVPTTKYNVTTTASGYTFPVLYIYPHDREYQIVADILPGQGWISNASIITGSKIMNVTTHKFSDTSQSVNVTFTDTTGTTSGGWVNITQDGILRQHYVVNTVNFTFGQMLTIPIGGSSVQVTSRTIGSNVSKDYAVQFTGPPVTIPGLDADLIMWGALFLIILTGLIATATTAATVSAIVCIEAWIFLTIGWLNPLVLRIGNEKVIGLFALATFLSIVWNLREGKRQETGR